MALTENNNAKTPDKKTLIFILISLTLLVGGSIGWIKLKQEQEKKIQQAQILLTQSCQNNLSGNTNVLDTSKKVGEASRLLQSLPNLPGLGYQNAQNELTNFSTCIKRAKATEYFVEAQKISKKALETDNQTIFTVQDWQTINSDLVKAIDLLKTIPPDVNFYNSAQKQIKLYQKKSQLISQKIQQEQAAVTAFSQAEDLQKQADTMIQNRPKIQTLSEAESKLQDAIKILESIPEATTVSDKSKENLSIYGDKLEIIKYRIATKQLQPLLKNFSDFAASLNTRTEYDNYSQRLKTLQDSFGNLIKQTPEIKSHPTVKALSTALSRYNDALILWRYCEQGNCSNSFSAGIGILDFREASWIPDSFKINNALLTKKYKVKTTANIFRRKYFQLNDALSQIWGQAKQDIQQAEE
ncbi:MAG: hypothetical protein ACHBN1_23945 [Heteroscytonema crispum UTEX LB 1556]